MSAGEETERGLYLLCFGIILTAARTWAQFTLCCLYTFFAYALFVVTLNSFPLPSEGLGMRTGDSVRECGLRGMKLSNRALLVRTEVARVRLC